MSTFLAWMSPATSFDMSQGVECSAGEPRSAVLGHCEAAPASSNAVFRGRVAEVCGDRARSATHIRERVPDRISQATTLALVEEPSSGSDASALGSKVNGRHPSSQSWNPEDSGLHGVVSSETESLFGASEASGEEIVDSLLKVEVFMPNLRAAGFRPAFAALDEVDLPLMFERRAVVMRSIPFFLRGPSRNAMLLALEEICASEALRRARGWKLFLLPRMLLHRPPRGGTMPKYKLEARFDKFARGQWSELLRESIEGSETAAYLRARRSRRRPADDLAARAERAQALVMMGEISSGRQALSGAAVAPRTDHTLNLLTNIERRPPNPVRELPPEMLEFIPEVPFALDEKRFSQNLRSSRRGAAPGPSDMTSEHLRHLLSRPADLHWLFRAGEQLARGEAPEVAVEAIRMGRMTALQKPDGGVRGIVAGDVMRCLVGRTVAQQIMPAVERFTAPFQYALRTRAGTECVAHVLQALTEANPDATVLSIDGVSAFDMVSRLAMLAALRRVPGGDQILPFIRLFYGSQSRYFWEDDAAVVHHILQGEGGEQGDPLMPSLLIGDP